MAAKPTSRWVITGARIVDGSGNPWFDGDVVIAGDTIATIAPAGTASLAGGELVAADGMIVCPGFIDIQSHSIVPFMSDRRSLSKVTQGVTTEIMGEAWTPSPFGGRIEDPFRDTAPARESDRVTPCPASRASGSGDRSKAVTG